MTHTNTHQAGAQGANENEDGAEWRRQHLQWGHEDETSDRDALLEVLAGDIDKDAPSILRQLACDLAVWQTAARSDEELTTEILDRSLSAIIDRARAAAGALERERDESMARRGGDQ